MSAIKCSNSLVSHSTTRVFPFTFPPLVATCCGTLPIGRGLLMPPSTPRCNGLCGVRSHRRVVSIRSFFEGACCCRIAVPFSGLREHIPFTPVIILLPTLSPSYSLAARHRKWNDLWLTFSDPRQTCAATYKKSSASPLTTSKS
jgi:hypothetical protein